MMNYLNVAWILEYVKNMLKVIWIFENHVVWSVKMGIQTRKHVCMVLLDSTPNHDYAILLDSTIGQVLEGFWCTYPGLRVETLGCDSRPSHDNSRRTSGTRDRQGLDLRLHDLDSRLDSRPLRLRLLTSTTRDQNVITRDLLVATRDRVFSSRDRLVSTGLPTMVIGPQHV